jgi:class 3 adenylate cyclase
MDHAQYTIIGDVVNLASRLESATKDHDVAVFFSKDVVAAAAAVVEVTAGVDTVVFGTISVKGREQQIEVFTLAPDLAPERAVLPVPAEMKEPAA